MLNPLISEKMESAEIVIVLRCPKKALSILLIDIWAAEVIEGNSHNATNENAKKCLNVLFCITYINCSNDLWTSKSNGRPRFMQAKIEQKVIEKRAASKAVHPAGVAAENFDKMGYLG